MQAKPCWHRAMLSTCCLADATKPHDTSCCCHKPNNMMQLLWHVPAFPMPCNCYDAFTNTSAAHTSW